MLESLADVSSDSSGIVLGECICSGARDSDVFLDRLDSSKVIKIYKELSFRDIKRYHDIHARYARKGNLQMDVGGISISILDLGCDIGLTGAGKVFARVNRVVGRTLDNSELAKVAHILISHGLPVTAYGKIGVRKGHQLSPINTRTNDDGSHVVITDLGGSVVRSLRIQGELDRRYAISRG